MERTTGTYLKVWNEKHIEGLEKVKKINTKVLFLFKEGAGYPRLKISHVENVVENAIDKYFDKFIAYATHRGKDQGVEDRDDLTDALARGIRHEIVNELGENFTDTESILVTCYRGKTSTSEPSEETEESLQG